MPMRTGQQNLPIKLNAMPGRTSALVSFTKGWRSSIEEAREVRAGTDGRTWGWPQPFRHASQQNDLPTLNTN